MMFVYVIDNANPGSLIIHYCLKKAQTIVTAKESKSEETIIFVIIDSIAILKLFYEIDKKEKNSPTKKPRDYHFKQSRKYNKVIFVHIEDKLTLHQATR